MLSLQHNKAFNTFQQHISKAKNVAQGQQNKVVKADTKEGQGTTSQTLKFKYII